MGYLDHTCCLEIKGCFCDLDLCLQKREETCDFLFKQGMIK